jgi:hypothetical protein
MSSRASSCTIVKASPIPALIFGAYSHHAEFRTPTVLQGTSYRKAQSGLKLGATRPELLDALPKKSLPINKDHNERYDVRRR